MASEGCISLDVKEMAGIQEAHGHNNSVCHLLSTLAELVDILNTCLKVTR